jgi:hypothetical protein
LVVLVLVVVVGRGGVVVMVGGVGTCGGVVVVVVVVVVWGGMAGIGYFRGPPTAECCVLPCCHNALAFHQFSWLMGTLASGFVYTAVFMRVFLGTTHITGSSPDHTNTTSYFLYYCLLLGGT